MPRLLIVTAVPAERDAVLGAWQPTAGQLHGQDLLRAATPAGLVDAVAAGVGAVAAALGTAALLPAGYDAVLSAGIAGGFPPAPVGSTAVADRVAFADLGAQLSDGGFASLAELGLGEVADDADPALGRLLAERSGAVTGTVLTVQTVTGTRARADRLSAAYPDAVAEGMEGAGVAAAARRAGVPFGELRTISNPVGPRDRENWHLGPALAALTAALAAVLAEPLAAPSKG
ncbi:MAG TPA: futalosine hydrolase [Jatrophihabitans sp.]|nr:futalosine hydrolase [Jatrophihabitans sp.]